MPESRNTLAFLSCWSILVTASQARAAITLVNGNSSAQFDLTSQVGNFNWTVEGVNQIAQQWFWYRIGSSGPEHSLDTLSAPVISQLDAGDFTATYTSPQLTIRILYSLLGSSPGSSDLTELTQITNLTNSVLDFHFFQYVDPDFHGSSPADSIYFANRDSVQQREGGTFLTETVDTTAGAATTHRQVDVFTNTLNLLNDALPTTLNDNMGPLLGPQNLTWCLEWDFLIGPHLTAKISTNETLFGAPEPMCLLLLALGSLMIGRQRIVGAPGAELEVKGVPHSGHRPLTLPVKS